MGYGSYIFVVVIAAAIMASAVYALYWAVKNGQFSRLDQDARIIFDYEEPEGKVTDQFPRKKGRANPPDEPRLGREPSPYHGKPT